MLVLILCFHGTVEDSVLRICIIALRSVYCSRLMHSASEPFVPTAIKLKGMNYTLVSSCICWDRHQL